MNGDSFRLMLLHLLMFLSDVLFRKFGSVYCDMDEITMILHSFRSVFDQGVNGVVVTRVAIRLKCRLLTAFSHSTISGHNLFAFHLLESCCKNITVYV